MNKSAAPGAVLRADPETRRLRTLRWIGGALGAPLALHGVSLVLAGYWGLWRLVPYLESGVWTATGTALVFLVAGSGETVLVSALGRRPPDLATARARILRAARGALIAAGLGGAWAAIMLLSPSPARSEDWAAAGWLALPLPFSAVLTLLGVVTPPPTAATLEAAAAPRVGWPGRCGPCVAWATAATMALLALAPFVATDARDGWPNTPLPKSSDAAFAAIEARAAFESAATRAWPAGGPRWEFRRRVARLEAALPLVDMPRLFTQTASVEVHEIFEGARHELERREVVRRIIGSPAFPVACRLAVIEASATLAAEAREIMQALLGVLRDPAVDRSADWSEVWWPERPGPPLRPAQARLRWSVLTALRECPGPLGPDVLACVRALDADPDVGHLARVVGRAPRGLYVPEDD